MKIHSSGRRLGHLYLTTAKRLDHETYATHSLTIATHDLPDTGDPLYAELKVKIIVIGVNDNAPKFTKSEYEVSINETMEIGSLIVQVSV